MDAAAFYNQLVDHYHLVFNRPFPETTQRHGKLLDAVIQAEWAGRVNTVLDVSCGIGTQSLGLARSGYTVTGSDLSPGAVARAKFEAAQMVLDVPFSEADMRQAYTHHQRGFDLVLSADNSVPHLLTDADILTAFQQFFACCLPGGGCLITVRDYEKEDLTSGKIRPYPVRTIDGKRCLIFQIWEFNGPVYDLAFYIVLDDGSPHPETHVFRTRYYAIPIPKLMDLLSAAGFENLKRHDEAYFQPVITGHKT